MLTAREIGRGVERLQVDLLQRLENGGFQRLAGLGFEPFAPVGIGRERWGGVEGDFCKVRKYFHHAIPSWL
jgi:hypothetical protein